VVSRFDALQAQVAAGLLLCKQRLDFEEPLHVNALRTCLL
jgi:hypothetical protein